VPLIPLAKGHQARRGQVQAQALLLLLAALPLDASLLLGSNSSRSSASRRSRRLCERGQEGCKPRGWRCGSSVDRRLLHHQRRHER
jgi:hypothetical protein